MIKTILSASCFLFLMACTQVNSSDEKTVTKDGDTVADVDISVSKLDALTNLVEEETKNDAKPIFKASGTEPGWLAEISAYKLRLIVDYGKDSVIIESDFDDLDNAKGFKKIIKAEKDESKNWTIELENKTCTDAAGNKADRAVTVSYKGTVYKGCGNFIK